MYRHILIPVENSETDRTILDHIRPLAKMTGARLLFLHVADGWVARHYEHLQLRESDEIKGDRRYLEALEEEFKKDGFDARFLLAMGEPSTEIIRVAKEEQVDLIAMTTHGHRLVGDLLYGSTADEVRHTVDVPVLLLKVSKADKAGR